MNRSNFEASLLLMGFIHHTPAITVIESTYFSFKNLHIIVQAKTILIYDFSFDSPVVSQTYHNIEEVIDYMERKGIS